MHNKDKLKRISQVTMKSVLVAFLYSIIFYILVIVCFYKDIKEIYSTINLISIDTSKDILEEVKINEVDNSLESYPEYGSEYANINIPSLDINLPVFFGDSLSILKKGIGHSSGSYFPGEGGSILYMGHNNVGYLNNLHKISKQDKIIVKTIYGTYTYEVYDYKVINYKELEYVPIQHDKEILMLYTCKGSYHTPNRFIVYANLIDKE